MTTLGQDFSVQMQRAAHIIAFQHAPQPVNFIRRLQKRVLAENGRVLSLHDILDFPDCFAGDIPDSLDMLRNEQQMVGIDVPMLDKSPRLFRAATGIALVHEPALVVHEAVQVPASPGQALTEVVRRHLQDFAADGIGGAEDLAQRKDQSLLAVQTKQHSHGATILRFLNQNRQCDGHALRVGQFAIGRAIDGRPVVGERRHYGLCVAALHVEDVIRRNAVEPGAELALTFERAELGDDFDEHFLRYLFGVVRLKDHADGDVVDPRLMPQDQLLQRRSVAVGGPCHQLGVFSFAIPDLREGIVQVNLHVAAAWRPKVGGLSI